MILPIHIAAGATAPEPFTTGPMRLLPILLLFGAMFYWLWRVRRRRVPVIVRNDGVTAAPGLQ